MEYLLIHFLLVYIRYIRVVELEVVKRLVALMKDTSTLQHAQAGSTQFSSLSAEDTLPSVVTPPTMATTTTIPFTTLNPY